MPTCERWCEVCWERFQMSNFFSVTREKNFSFDFLSRPKTIIHHRIVDCWVLWYLQRVQNAKQSEIVLGAWTHCRFDGLSLGILEQTWANYSQINCNNAGPFTGSSLWFNHLDFAILQDFNAILPSWMIQEPIIIFWLGNLGTILIRPSSLAYLPKHTITTFFGGEGKWSGTNLNESFVFKDLCRTCDTLPIPYRAS